MDGAVRSGLDDPRRLELTDQPKTMSIRREEIRAAPQSRLLLLCLHLGARCGARRATNHLRLGELGEFTGRLGRSIALRTDKLVGL